MWEVDVFAPGTRIYSTLPGGKNYGNLQGTSMAAPVVTGVAALILEFYPNLTPQQVKYCIEKSAVTPPAKVIKPGTENGRQRHQDEQSERNLASREAPHA